MKSVTVLDHKMTYQEMGEGAPILFLHGNPTSSYLWRNIMPHLSSMGRCIAPDLIGMGGSDKLDPAQYHPGPDRYRFVEHAKFLDGFIEALNLDQKVTLVIHDWGSALGFHWAQRHPERVRGIAYMEAIVATRVWDDFPNKTRPIFQAFRSAEGEKMVLENNFFIEQVLPGAILRNLTDEEMSAYRAPFVEPGESRRPTLTWPRELPIENEPADVCAIVESYGQWMAQNQLPKLFINADPGAILRGAQRDFCRTWPNQTEVTVKGVHFVQEDSPDEIGIALKDWVNTL